MAAAVDVGSISALTTGTGDSPISDAPVGVADGDLVLVFISTNASVTTGQTITSAPTGFEALLALTGAGSQHGWIYGKVAGASEPSTYTFQTSSTNTGWATRSLVVDDADLSNFPTSVVVDVSVATAASGDTVTVPGITMPADGLLLAQTGSRAGTGTTTSANMTALWTTISYSSRAARGFRESPSSGATGDRAFVVSGFSTTHVAGILGISPAPVGSPPDTPVISGFIVTPE